MEEFTITVAPIVGELRVQVTIDDFGEYQATIVGNSGCVGDGSTRDEAVANAVALHLHTIIRRINAGSWMPRVKRSF